MNIKHAFVLIKQIPILQDLHVCGKSGPLAMQISALKRTQPHKLTERQLQGNFCLYPPTQGPPHRSNTCASKLY